MRTAFRVAGIALWGRFMFGTAKSSLSLLPSWPPPGRRPVYFAKKDTPHDRAGTWVVDFALFRRCTSGRFML
jgi:hypothetical protein